MRWRRSTRRSGPPPLYTLRRQTRGWPRSSILAMPSSVRTALALLCSPRNRIAHIVHFIGVHVPGNALGRYLRVLTQEVERISGRPRIEFLGHELGLLFGRLVLHSRPAIQNR